MGKLVDLRGKRFGRLMVLAQATAPGHALTERAIKKVYWLCECHEGNRVVVAADNLRSGMTKSCGCLLREHARLQAIRAPRNANVNGYSAFNQGVEWSVKQLQAAGHTYAANLLREAADDLPRAPAAAWPGTVTRVADDGRAVVVRNG